MSKYYTSFGFGVILILGVGWPIVMAIMYFVLAETENNLPPALIIPYMFMGLIGAIFVFKQISHSYSDGMEMRKKFDERLSQLAQEPGFTLSDYMKFKSQWSEIKSVEDFDHIQADLSAREAR